LRNVPIRIKKCEKVIKLYRNSKKLYEKFWEKFLSGSYEILQYKGFCNMSHKMST